MNGKGIFLRLFFAVSLFLSVSYGDTNVLENPGFESGEAGWSARGGSFTTVTSPVYSGSYSGHASSRTADWQGIQQNMTGKMVEGKTYQVSGWVRTNTSTSSDVRISFQQTDGDGTNWHWAAVGTASDSGWTQITGSFTLNVTGTLSELLAYVEGPDSGIDIYLDDAVVYGPVPGPVDPNATGVVDVNISHQEIEGFGAAGAWYENWLTSNTQSEALYDLFFDDLGLDIYRVRNTYDYDPDYMFNTGVIVGEALERNPNLKILISSWSPPPYLKSNSSTSGGGDATLAGGPSSYVYSQFADWWANSLTDTNDGWPSYGVDADYISIQNEPDYDASWDSCRLDPTENSSVAGYNDAFEAVYSELNSRFGSSMPKMLGPEATGFYGASGYSLDTYLSAIINPSHVYGYCHHLYNINAGDNPDAYIAAMQNLNSSWGNKPLFQTEYEKSSAPPAWPDAYNMALLLHNSLVEEEMSGYIYWDLFWNSGGLVTIPSYGGDTYIINSDYYGFKHYSAFIHSGWQRIDAETDSDALRISTYISPDNNQLSIVVINTDDETDIELDLDFMEQIVYGDIYRTSREENCALVGNYYGEAPLMLPAESITTLALTAEAENTAPVAVAGPNQVVPASGSGYATVELDGSGSFDNEGDPLNYYWSWSYGGEDYEVNGVSPTIQLPTGEHTIELVVDDGLFESEPDYCKIKVVAPLQANLFCLPRVLKSNTRHGWLLAIISMPSDIHKADIDHTEPLVFNPGQVESKCWYVFESRRRWRSRTYIWAWFKKSDCIEQLEPGFNEVSVTGKLTSGQPFDASDCLKLIVPKPKKWPWWPPFGRWWGRGHGKWH